MGERVLRIQTPVEFRSEKATDSEDPYAEIAAYYLDRILSRIDLSPDFFVAVVKTLDDSFRRRLAEILYPGTLPEDLREVSGRIDADVFGRQVRRDWNNRIDLKNAPNEDGSSLAPIAKVKLHALASFRAYWTGRPLRDPIADRRERLAKVFGLNEQEIEIIAFLWCMARLPLINEPLSDFPLRLYQSAMACCVGVDHVTLRGLLAPDGKLRRMGLVDHDPYPPPHYALSGEISNFLADPDNFDSFVMPLERLGDSVGRRMFPLESYPVSTLARGILDSLLRGGRESVLLYGEPGTGKTSFALALVQATGLPAFFLSAVKSMNDARPNIVLLQIAARRAKECRAVLIVDEADGVLNTEWRERDQAAHGKAWLAEFLDYHSGAILWIANEVDGLHEAVKRRFAYSLEFKAPGERQRKVVWETLTREYGFSGALDGQDLSALSKRHRVSAGGVDVALRGLRSVLGAPQTAANRPEPMGILSEILRSHETLMTGERTELVPARSASGGRYLAEALNVDVSLEDLTASLAEVARAVRDRKDSRDDLGGEGRTEEEELLEAKLLFSGGPGTGKTAFARHLTDSLGLDLVQKRASDLLSPFVGMTEHLIAKAFLEAEDAGAVLLLDEADSLFIDRGRAERNWERSQTNELLTRMEAFSGILICCTNRRSDFDSAAMRRFQWKLSFSPPRADQREALYRRYFSSLCGEPDREVLDAVARLDGLCPGDFSAVHKAFAPLSAARGGACRTHTAVLERLRSELSYRAERELPRIGFK